MFNLKISLSYKELYFEMIKIASLQKEIQALNWRIPIHIKWFLIAFWLCCSVTHAEESSDNKQSIVHNKIKLMLDPVNGLNLEIQAGLQKIEQTCALISKSKVNETKLTQANSADAKQQLFNKEISSARLITQEQVSRMEGVLSQNQAKIEASAKSCESTPKLNSTAACKDYRQRNEISAKVAQASSYYYSEALARLASYSRAYELESKGCTRAGFAFRLWSAEQEHLLPTLKTSSQSFADLLN